MTKERERKITTYVGVQMIYFEKIKYSPEIDSSLYQEIAANM